MPLLPQVTRVEAFAPLLRQPDVWRPAVAAVCARHGLDPRELEPATTGSNPVFVGPARVVKLFAPCWSVDAAVEVAALEWVGPRLAAACPIPRLDAAGELEGWPYLVLERLPGEAATTAWPRLRPNERRAVSRELGALLRELHALPTAGLPAVLAPPARDDPARDDPARDGRAFLAGEAERCRAKHARAGASSELLRELDASLAELDLDRLHPPGAPDVLLHADVTDEHVLIVERDGRPRLSGLIDFADAMLGAPLYELVAPGVLLGRGDPVALAGLLEGYGLQPSPELSARLHATALLHRYGTLPQLVEAAPGGAGSLLELEGALWPA